MDSYRVVMQFAPTLRNLDAVLDKAEKHAEARKFDVNNFCTARLAPDMLPFLSQIRIACDHAKSAAANLSDPGVLAEHVVKRRSVRDAR